MNPEQEALFQNVDYRLSSIKNQLSQLAYSSTTRDTLMAVISAIDDMQSLCRELRRQAKTVEGLRSDVAALRARIDGQQMAAAVMAVQGG